MRGSEVGLLIKPQLSMLCDGHTGLKCNRTSFLSEQDRSCHGRCERTAVKLVKVSIGRGCDCLFRTAHAWRTGRHGKRFSFAKRKCVFMLLGTSSQGICPGVCKQSGVSLKLCLVYDPVSRFTNSDCVCLPGLSCFVPLIWVCLRELCGRINPVNRGLEQTLSWGIANSRNFYSHRFAVLRCLRKIAHEISLIRTWTACGSARMWKKLTRSVS